MNVEEIVKNTLNDIASFRIDDVPDIDLYMDQVTTYLNKIFDSSKRYDDDKLLTKTMINNYAKSRLLPAPEKKKYSKDHIIILAMIFFFKNVISINDVTTILSPLINQHFHNDDSPIENIVNTFLDYTKNNDITNSIVKECEDSSHMFENIEDDDKEYLQTLGFISILCYEMFARKMMIERLIDSLAASTSEHEDKKAKSEKDEKKNKIEKEDKKNKEKRD